MARSVLTVIAGGAASLMLAAGSAHAAQSTQGMPQFGRQSPQNGIVGDARRSSAELGKLAIDMKVEFAVKQIRSLLPSS